MKDHRDLAKESNLYATDKKMGQGMPFLLPNYVIIRNLLQGFIRQKWKEFGFQEVITPVLGTKEIYETSGHLVHYSENMFPQISKNNEDYFLRAMTCPQHCLIYQTKPRSQQDLPLRIAENSLLFRYETSGSLKGLERIRCFELADHHTFVNLEILEKELEKNLFFVEKILKILDFKINRVVCSLHDPENKKKYHNQNELWKVAEETLINVLTKNDVRYETQKDEAAFYGPKIDFEIQVTDGKYVTLSTIQLDFFLPERFKLKYLDREQQSKTPVIIHQSPIGSYQRAIALLLEQSEGKLPTWLSPIQLVILPINDKEVIKNYCLEIIKKINNLRAEIWEKKTINSRIKKIHDKKIPFFLIIGLKETESKEFELVFTYQNRKKIIKEQELDLLINNINDNNFY